MKKYAGRCPDGFIDALDGWDRAEVRAKKWRAKHLSKTIIERYYASERRRLLRLRWRVVIRRRCRPPHGRIPR